MKRISKILSIVIALMLTFALVACNKDPDKEDPAKPDTGLTDNLVLDENGQPLFEEEVTVKMWSVIGDPDQVVFAKLVQQFNNEMMGQIKIDVSYQGHFDYYSALDSTWQSDRGNFPDVCFMHNEKTIEYAAKGYFWALDDIFEKTNVALDFSLVYPDINRVTMYKGERYGVPVDAHGFLTQFRQDIIKKNGLGFDNNTRFIPESRAEYQQLLTALRAKADAGELWTRNINKGMDHSWVKANKDTFYPSFSQSTDPDGLSALYANGGTLVNEAGDKVNFQNNKGFETYITDQVNRYNAREVGTSGTNTEMFGNGNAVMFSEGPWWIAQTYSLQWNSAEMKQAANGISAEDAADPIINTPMTSSRPLNWWTLDEYIGTESGSKWFANGHVICLSKNVKDYQTAAAALVFMQWYTQAKAEDGGYILTDWCQAGHIPAWKNVYDSADFQAAKEKSLTLKALGDPAQVMALEGLEYASTLFNGVANSCTTAIQAMESDAGCTVEQAIQIIKNTATSTQTTLDLLKLGF